MTLVYRGENILRGFDDDVREHLRGEMERRGIKIITRQTVAAVEKVDHGYDVELSDNTQIMVDKVMFATGRHPNVGGFGLEDIGVKIAGNGGIAVDEFSKTSVANIYAVGDVTNRINLTPVAIREGPRLRRYGVRRQADAGRSRQRADRGVFRARDRRHRPDRSRRRASGSPRSTSTRPASGR